MKTAMQELIEEFKYVQEFPMILGIIKRAELLLEKEKEQILDAYLKGYIHYYPKVDSKEYYNQTYNQNK